MSGSFPTSPAPSRLSYRTRVQTLVSQAQSLRLQRRSRGGHRFEFQADWEGWHSDDLAAIWAFVLAQRGRYGSFTFTPALSRRGTGGGTPLVNNASGYAVGTTSIAIDGCTAGVTNWMRAGDVFKFAGHSKVYQCSADVNSNGSGQVAALTFFPALHVAVADNEALTVSSVPFTVCLGDDSQDLVLTAPYRASLSLSMVEVW